MIRFLIILIFQAHVSSLLGQSKSDASAFASIVQPVGVTYASEDLQQAGFKQLSLAPVQLSGDLAASKLFNRGAFANRNIIRQIASFQVIANATMFDVTVGNLPLLPIHKKSEALTEICCFTVRQYKIQKENSGANSFEVSATINLDLIKAPGIYTVNVGPDVTINFN